MQIKPLGKVMLLILVLGLAIGGWRFWNRLAPEAATKNAVVPGKMDLPSNSGNGEGKASVVPVSTDLGCSDKPEVRLLGYAWNAQMGMLYAIGGEQAAQGSLACKRGVNLKFNRQDDNGKLQEALVAFATELSQGNPNPSKGAHFVTVMGDGSASFLQGLNQSLGKIGPEYKAKIINAIGYSRGEDKLMGPPQWKTNPAAAKGSLVAGVVRDGDWNIAQKWLGDNGIPTNPDEKTYDPNAMNWVNASDYLDAAEKYIAGYSEDRPIVVNGKKTGETKHITVNGVVTWTPGDVNIAEKKGGLVSIVSTKEYNSQMPCVVIGIDKWMKDNKPTVVRFVQAVAEGNQKVKSDPAALAKAAAISAKAYNDAGSDAAYWEKYYKGVTQKDKAGLSVDLGGSSVNTLADTQVAFGLVPGSADLVSATYSVFGNLVKTQYPELMPSVAPASDVIDKSYIIAAIKESAPSKADVAASRPMYKTPRAASGGANPAPAALVGRRQWNIRFNEGAATFSPEAKQLLNQLSPDLLVAGGTVVEIHGHTDNQGDPKTSLPLSQARASAVKKYLETTAPVNFPQGRIQAIAHGETQPIAPNNTAEGRAKNRRVEIILRSAT